MRKLPDDWLDRMNATTRTTEVVRSVRASGGSQRALREAEGEQRDAMRDVLTMIGTSGRRPAIRTGMYTGMGMRTGTRRTR